MIFQKFYPLRCLDSKLVTFPAWSTRCELYTYVSKDCETLSAQHQRVLSPSR